jgi:hypothetical protein
VFVFVRFQNYGSSINSSLIAEIQVLPLQKLEDLRDVLFNFVTLAMKSQVSNKSASILGVSSE